MQPHRYRPTARRDTEASGPRGKTVASTRNGTGGNKAGPIIITLALVVIGALMFWAGWPSVNDHSLTPSEYMRVVYLPENGGLVKSVLIEYIRKHADIPGDTSGKLIEDWINDHAEWEVREVLWSESQLRPRGFGAPTKDAEDFGWFHNYGDYKVASVPVIARGSGPLPGYGNLLLDAQVDVVVEATQGRDGGPRIEREAGVSEVVGMTLNEKRSFLSFGGR